MAADLDRIYFNPTDAGFQSKYWKEDVTMTILADETLGVDAKKTGQQVFPKRISKAGKPYWLVDLPAGKYFINHGTNDRGEYLVARKAEDRAPNGAGAAGSYKSNVQRPKQYGARPTATR